jgi:acyl-CoA thioesterase-1
MFDRMRRGCIIESMKLLALLSALIVFCVVLDGCQSHSAPNTAASHTPAQPSARQDAAATAAPASSNVSKIVAFGDSLTAGYGLAPADAYTSLLQKKLDQDGYRYEVVNAGISGDTSADGLSRIDWSLDTDVKILILELGANDILRMQPISQMKKNLTEIIERAKAKGVEVLLAGMEAPTNSDPIYRAQAHKAFPDLARDEHVILIPFVLDRVGGVPALNQKDGIHPNAEGEKIMTQTVYEALRPMLKK